MLWYKSWLETRWRFFAGLGLFLSVVMRTVLRANLVLLIVAVLLIAVTFVTPFGLNPLTYLEPFVSIVGTSGISFITSG